jgi:hypothetical protein
VNRKIAGTGLTLIALLALGVGISAAAPPRVVTSTAFGIANGGDVLPGNGQSPATPMKIKGGGQIDVSTFTLTFAGQSTYLGQYTGTGIVDPSTFQIQGSMTAANGDILDWNAYFQLGPLGEIEATFNFTGGTGRFVNASGTATGPVVLDPDFMFTINLLGTLSF